MSRPVALGPNPTESPIESLAERLRVALELADAGFDLMRQNLRRAHPEAGPEEIEARLASWIDDRPMDCPGPVRRVRAG